MQLHNGFGPIMFCDLCPLCLVATGQPDSTIRPSTVLGPLVFKAFPNNDLHTALVNSGRPNLIALLRLYYLTDSLIGKEASRPTHFSYNQIFFLIFQMNFSMALIVPTYIS